MKWERKGEKGHRRCREAGPDKGKREKNATGRRKRKGTFKGPLRNLAKKGQKNVQLTLGTGNKKGEEVREQFEDREVEG